MSPPAIAPAGTGVRIFFAHGVVERKTDRLLERNFHLLSSFREVVSGLRRMRTIGLEDLVDLLTMTRPPSAPAVLLTFDDGYANNFRAWEVLSAASIPFVIFVSTGSVGTPRSIWTAELSLLMLHGRARQVDLLDRRWPLARRSQRETAFQVIRRQLKRLPAPQRRAAMEALREQFPRDETARLLEAYPAFRMLSWRQLQELAAAGVVIGSHGVDHELHHTMQPAGVREHELQRSRATLTRRLGRPCRAFAFPNGDVTTRSAEEVRAAGYAFGFTIDQGIVRSGINPYLLPRLKLAATAQTLLADFRLGRGRPIVR